MFFLQQAIPDTSAYMIAGYAVIFGIMLIYILSLAIRRRNLQQDLELLQDMDRESASDVQLGPVTGRTAEKDLAPK